MYPYAHPRTDYVFDGTSPPYTPSARTNPLNLYGRTKRDGELAVLGVPGAKAVVLRVPVLCVPLPQPPNAPHFPAPPLPDSCFPPLPTRRDHPEDTDMLAHAHW